MLKLSVTVHAWTTDFLPGLFVQFHSESACRHNLSSSNSSHRTQWCKIGNIGLAWLDRRLKNKWLMPGVVGNRFHQDEVFHHI